MLKWLKGRLLIAAAVLSLFSGSECAAAGTDLYLSGTDKEPAATAASLAELNAGRLYSSAVRVAGYAGSDDFAAIAAELQDSIYSQFDHLIKQNGHIELAMGSQCLIYCDVSSLVPDAYGYGIFIGDAAACQDGIRNGAGRWIVFAGQPGTDNFAAVSSAGTWTGGQPAGLQVISVYDSQNRKAAEYSGNTAGGLFEGQATVSFPASGISITRTYAGGWPVKYIKDGIVFETAVMSEGGLREQQLIMLGTEYESSTAGVPGYCTHDWKTDTAGILPAAEGEGFRTQGGRTEYTDASGHKASGLISTENGLFYIPEDGYVIKGWNCCNDRFFYVGSDGRILRDAEVTPYRVDGAGMLIRDEDGQERDAGIGRTAEKILLSVVSGDMTREEQLRACYDYVLSNTVYRRTYETPEGRDWTRLYALDALVSGQGNCFRYAAAFAYLADAVGYEARICTGQISARRGGTTPHGWVEILTDNGWFICDPDMQDATGGDYYMKSFSQYPVKPLVTEARWEARITEDMPVLDLKMRTDAGPELSEEAAGGSAE
ncbi:MAG: transglutaminase domain-containing protein [Lachnospiraceae bacterium]|nr:transglutaminase domain-containing protein [Lachnospiraceae bacterium]